MKRKAAIQPSKSNNIKPIHNFVLSRRFEELEVMEVAGKSITDKEFYKAMQKLKDRGANAVPPKKSASAYILFGKDVNFFFFLFPYFLIHIIVIEKGGNIKKKSPCQGDWGRQGDSPVLGRPQQGGKNEIQGGSQKR